MSSTTLPATNESVDIELYDDLLGRYERILVYAGQLQEKLKQQKLLTEKTGQLENENTRLKKLAALDKSYIHLLEKALEALEVMRPEMTDRSHDN